VILGYQCDKCKAVVDEVNKISVKLSDGSGVLTDFWFCEDCVDIMFVELNTVYKENIVEKTDEVKTVDIFKVEKVLKTKMSRR